MKKHFWIALALSMTIGTADVEAQGFLKKLEKTVKKEVEKKVTDEVNKRVNKGKDKGVEAISGKNQQQQDQPQAQPETSQEQSAESHNERHLRKLAEKGEIVRPVVENPPQNQAPVTGKTNGHEWIDLGLPSGTRWATCNIGAQTSEEFGKTYAWAEITPASDKNSSKNKVRGKWMSGISGSTTYDAAAALWGGGWEMPTKVNFTELMENCTWEFTTLGRSKGLKATSKINGNYIFFPIQFHETFARYWASTPGKDSHYYTADALFVGKDMISVGSEDRKGGCPIRPVTK